MLEESLQNEDEMLSSYSKNEELTEPDDDANAVLYDIPQCLEGYLDANESEHHARPPATLSLPLLICTAAFLQPVQC